jgi:hypothetical protein
VRTVQISIQRPDPAGGAIGMGTGVMAEVGLAGVWLFPDGGAWTGSEPVAPGDGTIVHPDEGSIG